MTRASARLRLPSRKILERGGVPIVISHLGRPKGERKPMLSLRMVQSEISAAVGDVPIRFAEDIETAEPSDVGRPKAESVLE